MRLTDRIAGKNASRFGGWSHFRYLDLEELREVYESACCLNARVRLTVGDGERSEWPGCDLLMLCPTHPERRLDLLLWRRHRAIRERHIEEYAAELRAAAVELVR